MTLVLLRGISCSGKSTLAANFEPATTISSDRIREEMMGTAQVPPTMSTMIWGEVNRRLHMRMKAKLFTILDATNLGMKSIRKAYNVADQYGVDTFVVSLKPNVEVCKERLHYRKLGVERGVILPCEELKRQYESYETKKQGVKNFFGDRFFEGDAEDCENFIRMLTYEQNRVEVTHERVFVIGDVHGNLVNLRNVATKIPNDAIYFSVGDLIDRGEDSFGVMDFLMNDSRFAGFTTGNHESAFLNERRGAPCRSKARAITHCEFDQFNEIDQAKYLRFMYSGQNYIIVENVYTHEEVLISHAGIGDFDPEKVSVYVASSHQINPVEEYEGTATQIHGHKSWEFNGNFSGTVVNIDSGESYGTVITAFNPFTREVLTSE